MAILYNSDCSTLGVGCYLYNGPGLTNPVANGYYSDGSNCYTVTGGSGYISIMDVCSTFVTIDYYVPTSATCYQYYTFVANANATLSTSVDVEIIWYGDLGGSMSGTVTIPSGNNCNSNYYVYSSFGLNCWGENLSYLSVTLNPSSYGSQIYQVGTQLGYAPC